MRAWTALLLAALVAGCLGPPSPPPRAVVPADVGFDPSTLRITGVEVERATLASWDGARLAAVAYVPQTPDRLPDGSAPRWPVAVFVHGWGQQKESFEGQRSSVPGVPVADGMGVNRLEQFARAGILAIAYDARGFGASEGRTTVAGPAERMDLGAVIDFATARYPTNGRVGVVGASYGGGHALQAWAGEPKVTTAVAMYGWVDLYGALLPQNVPKLEWAQLLYLYGAAGAKGEYDPMIHSWYQQVYTRSDLATVRRQMDERSVLPTTGQVRKPLLLCQGLQETLFPQADQAWEAAGGFTRAVVFTGGHGASDPACWARALAWLQFFLGGHDTKVDQWPALQAVDASGIGPPTEYEAFPRPASRTFHPRLEALDAGPASNATFTVQQRLAANPLHEPGALWDASGMPAQRLPAGLREDPAGSLFTSPPLADAEVVAGAPHLRLHVREGDVPHQVAATLYLLRADGTSSVLSRGAAAALNQSDLRDGFLEVPMTWTHAAAAAGDRLQLKVASNDPAWWMPLLADYTVTFDGRSALDVPFLG